MTSGVTSLFMGLIELGIAVLLMLIIAVIMISFFTKLAERKPKIFAIVISVVLVSMIISL